MSDRAWARTAAALAVLLALLIGVVAVVALVPGPGGTASASTAPTTASGTASPSASSGDSPLPSFVRPTPTPVPAAVSYTVRTGDTLTSIAAVFRTTARSIAFWNSDRYPSLDPLSAAYNPNAIGVGWSLTILPGQVFDESSLPAATPSPSATATTVPSPSPSATAGAPSVVVSHGSRGTAQIALTFDMGGRLDPALDIMDWLVAHEVHATIFATGATGSTTTTGRAVLARIAAHPDLFVLGNHSWDHPDFTTLTASAIASQLTRTEAALAALAGRSTRPWFRPPYGAWNTAVVRAVGAAGWANTVMWDIDTIDWRPTTDGGPVAADIEAKVLSNAQGGSIVLMHLGGYHTLEALPAIVAGLHDRGLVPVTLDDLFGG